MTWNYLASQGVDNSAVADNGQNHRQQVGNGHKQRSKCLLRHVVAEHAPRYTGSLDDVGNVRPQRGHENGHGDPDSHDCTVHQALPDVRLCTIFQVPVNWQTSLNYDTNYRNYGTWWEMPTKVMITMMTNRKPEAMRQCIPPPSPVLPVSRYRAPVTLHAMCIAVAVALSWAHDILTL